MGGDREGDPGVRQQAVAGRDAWVIGRDLVINPRAEDGDLSAQRQGYLAALRKTAGAHLYPGTRGDLDLPALADVYVPQQAVPWSSAGHGSGSAAPVPGAAGPAPHAEEVFRAASSITVLVAPAGGGKSALLRTYRAGSAGRWLDGEAGGAAPVLVNASALTAQVPLPAALAKAATIELTSFGLLDELSAGLFRCPPRPGAPWLVLVDGLDELPDAGERRGVLEKLASAAVQDPPLYRFVVATRPLPGNELSVLGRQVQHYELQPFTGKDLRAYAGRYFGALWPPEEAARRARRFAGALRGASLDDLARTPLTAFMLCQLYLADPERPLPGGRTAVYEAFTDLVYENNQGKRVADSHEESVRRLVESVQSPRAREEADVGARQACRQLPELIGYLACQWLSGRGTTVAGALASHGAVRRPGKVRPERWEAFLGDLLRHTGLLVQSADGLGFPHQTFLEYHAARHATRDEAARAELLRDLFPPQEPGGPPQPPRHAPSYTGFLLDGLLGAGDSTAVETARRIETLADRGKREAILNFLVVQAVHLKTNLPVEPIAGRLLLMAEQPSVYDPMTDRVMAAWQLSLLDGYREAGAGLLTQFIEDDHSRIWDRVGAACYLGLLEEYQQTAAAWLARFTRAALLEVDERSLAAEGLARVEGYQEAGAAWLARFAEDTSIKAYDRIEAAKALTRVEGHKEAGVTWLARFAEDTSLAVHDRMQAAQGLTLVREEREPGAAWLARFAGDTAAGDYERVWSAWQLALMDEHEEAGAALLARFAEQAAFNGEDRVWAAWGLAQLDGHREAGSAWLLRFAADPVLGGKAAQRLAEVDKDAYASLLARTAEDTTQTNFDRALAAWKLADIDGHRQASATLLGRLIGSTETLSPKEALERIFDLRVPPAGPGDSSAC
jgi:hypothetical protein